MDTCARCGAELGVGRFCLNCGHRIGDPVRPPAPRPAPVRPVDPAAAAPPAAATVSEAPPPDVPVQAADPVPVPPAPAATSSSPRTAPVLRRRRPAATAAPDPAPAAPPWDPERDLLPYHDADELGPDEPLSPRGWIPWVVGAVVLVALVLVLLRVFDSEPVAGPTPDDTSAAAGGSGGSSSAGAGSASEAPASDAPAASEDPAVPQGTGPRTDAALTATFAVPATAPPTTDLDGNLVAYDAAQMGDGNPATTWRTAGDATGQTVTITLASPAVLDRVGLVNGYAKQVAGVDWYPNNRRILAVTWGFDDGTTVQQTLAERPGVQRLKVPPVETSTVTLRIDEVTPPGSGPLGRDYTAISEVTLVGRRAG